MLRIRTRAVLSVGAALYLAVVGWVTLGPQPLDDNTDGWLRTLLGLFSEHWLTAWITYDLVEFLANIAMFVPIGCVFLLLLGRRRWWLALLLGIVLTCVIEFTQQFLPTRVSDVRDIIANSLGALIGVVIGLLILRVRAPRR